MLAPKTIITAVAALGCAIGIGFFMQSSESAQAHYGTVKSGSDAAEQLEVEVKGAGIQGSMLDVQEITLTSAEVEAETQTDLTAPVTEVTHVSTSSDPSEEAMTPEAELTMSCEITANARPIAAAMVDLSLTAPCLPNERVTVHHNGMIFTETTSADGALAVDIPALTSDAVFILAFSNGEGAVAQTSVEELADFDRAVVQWKGDTGFEIHAREFGADYDTEGHIWRDRPGDLAAAVAGDSGMLTRLGTVDAPEPLLAEVYTFPKTGSARQGTVALSVETEVTEANCGQEIEAQSLEVQADGDLKTQNLILPVPECDAKGSFLVLNNLLQDLKVAGK